MRKSLLLVAAVTAGYCQDLPSTLTEVALQLPTTYSLTPLNNDPWKEFLRHLPTRTGAVVDYTGAPIANQSKHTAVLTYDVGRQDLQQCADALMRLRAEYLFQQRQYDKIGFHFTSGDLYTWKDYCRGLRPRPEGSGVVFVPGTPHERDHASLRAYLDIVYAYAGTISLARELKEAKGFEVGTIIIKPGSPGHCCIVVDEAVRSDGKKVYKLAEGYTPAQSIYILKNPQDRSPWYELKEGEPVLTSSYHFTTYQLRRF